MPDARSPGECPVFRSQHPQTEAMLIPMRHIGVEIGLRLLRRTDAAEIARNLGIEMQRDEVGEMIFTKPFGAEPRRSEMFHWEQIAASEVGRRVTLTRNDLAGSAFHRCKDALSVGRPARGECSQAEWQWISSAT
jgi:hypothetical protein